MQSDDTNTEVEFATKKIYLKDLSFESPQAPDIFFSQTSANPQVNVNIKTFTNHQQQNLYESVILLNLEVILDSKKLFIVEVEYAGLFHVYTENKELLEWILNVNCPSIIYPYVRELVDSSVVKGGFPPLILEHIDFAAKYKQEKLKEQN